MATESMLLLKYWTISALLKGNDENGNAMETPNSIQYIYLHSKKNTKMIESIEWMPYKVD